ncbi:acyltransferase domain-containing protein [Nonomuraea longicatena]|uniref:Acyltransferase n=1 Tax=Nonomuraea longicatena TaxID=83682 RepID=A0ABN1QEU3_9ACTN
MDIKHVLREHPEWLDHLESVGPVDVRFPHDLLGELLRLAVPHEDIGGVLAGLPAPGDPHWWLLERCVGSLVASMGDTEAPPRFPELPELGPYFYVHVYLAALPYTRAYHREHGIPEHVAQATLADLGRNMAVHRKRFRAPGLHAPFWFMLHARGMIYQLGRLQFERSLMREGTASGVRAAGMDPGDGNPALDVHIPDFCGPMDPASCDRSFARAAEFFPRHFPKEKYLVATCHSWLLDEQLARYLPEGSNIIAFQRRFHLLHRFETGVLGFVFGADAEADPLPRRSSLERAIADHLAEGGSWYGRAGWLRLS